MSKDSIMPVRLCHQEPNHLGIGIFLLVSYGTCCDDDVGLIEGLSQLMAFCMTPLY